MTREYMPAERPGITHAFKILSSESRSHVCPKCGHAFSDLVGTVKGYLTANWFEDGRVGEVFLKLDQQGSAVSGFCDAWAIATSMLLQSGTPLSKIVEKFRGSRFQPAGRVKNAPGDIHFCVSALDYVTRFLDHRFLQTDKSKEPEESDEPKQLEAPADDDTEKPE